MLALGKALMGKPGLLMLDEPSLGLAPNVVREILQTICSLNEKGITIFWWNRMPGKPCGFPTGPMFWIEADHPDRRRRRAFLQRRGEEGFLRQRLPGKMGEIREAGMPIFKPEVETLTRKDLQELQSERLQIVVNQAYANVDFYRRKFDEAGLTPDDIKTLDDLRKVPFTTRKDLMENYPYGMFAVPLRDVVRLQFPLGIYGNPIVIGYTREDLKIWRELVARIMVGIGITEHDIVQVAFNYGSSWGPSASARAPS